MLPSRQRANYSSLCSVQWLSLQSSWWSRHSQLQVTQKGRTYPPGCCHGVPSRLVYGKTNTLSVLLRKSHIGIQTRKLIEIATSNENYDRIMAGQSASLKTQRMTDQKRSIHDGLTEQAGDWTYKKTNNILRPALAVRHIIYAIVSNFYFLVSVSRMTYEWKSKKTR
jgi:hypothetical protein